MQVLPFVRLFQSSPSTFLGEDSVVTVHHIPQNEGGEQGDPLMPLWYALGQHSALVAASERLRGDEILFAFLDDLNVKSSPDRAVQAHQTFSEELWRRARIRLSQGKICMWNRVGQMPFGCERLEAAARADNPDARVWRGDLQVEPSQRGIVILGTLVGTPEFVQQQLEQKVVEHETFLQRVPELKDLQWAWLLLLFCGVAEANFLLRTIGPALSHTFAARHDAQIWRCFSTLVGLSPDAVCHTAKVTAWLPLAAGGLGLRSATKLRLAAHWASWADTIQMVNERRPEVAEQIRRLATVTKHPASKPLSPVKPVWKRPDSSAQRDWISPLAERKPNRSKRSSRSRTNPGWGGSPRQRAKWSPAVWKAS